MGIYNSVRKGQSLEAMHEVKQNYSRRKMIT